MTSCYCDYGQPDVYRANRRVARIEHRCYECHRKILPGERYEYVFCVFDDGDQTSTHTCSRCLDLRDFVLAHVPCSCWMHGNANETLIEDAAEWAHEAPGLLFGALRRRVLIERAR